MTQIKLRRDTAANFTSKNPVLGVGEPAYETDTKKLKIGDGTTAYTQLEYFSAGGGSSTDISATLPLKIVDGVISLEVDGQTIQIVDGKLHANLDELGNEVNDLSGRVAAAEADLANKASKSDLAAKQDKLSPIAPLGINKTTISNVTDGTFLTDTSVTLNSAFNINYTTDANARFLITASGGGGATPTSFIQIPFTLGDLISFPYEQNGDSKIGLVFGYWKDNLFYPTMLYKTYDYYGSLGSSGYAPFAFASEAGKSSLEKIATYYGLSSAVSKSELVYHESIPLNATNYIQVTKNAGVPTVNMWFTISGASSPNTGYTQRMYTSDTTVLENLNKTNVCLLLSNNTSKAINLTKVTRRELGDTVLSPTVDALTTALNTYSNSFDATDKVVTNDLSLSIGAGLAITDGKLTASSTTPTNMVTTDTSQDITGKKSFTTGKIQFKNTDSNRKILGEINGNGYYCNYYTNKTSGEKPCYLGKVSQTVFNLGIPDATGTEGRIYATTLEKWQSTRYIGTILDSSNLGSYVDGTTITYTNNKLSATGGGSAPTNMVTTDTEQTITGNKTFQESITIGNTGTGQIDKLKLAALNGSSTATTLYNGLQVYTDIDTYTSTLRVGDVNLPMILQGSTIKDSNGNNFLKTKSLTQSEYDGLTTKDDSILYVITD